MVLSGSLLDSHQEVFVFLNQSLDQRLVLRWQARNQFSETAVFTEVQGASEMAATLFANESNGLQSIRLSVDRRDAGRHVHSLTLHNEFLFLIKQGKHFTVLLEFVPQGFNPMI